MNYSSPHFPQNTNQASHEEQFVKGAPIKDIFDIELMSPIEISQPKKKKLHSFRLIHSSGKPPKGNEESEVKLEFPKSVETENEVIEIASVFECSERVPERSSGDSVQQPEIQNQAFIKELTGENSPEDSNSNEKILNLRKNSVNEKSLSNSIHTTPWGLEVTNEDLVLAAKSRASLESAIVQNKLIPPQSTVSQHRKCMIPKCVTWEKIKQSITDRRTVLYEGEILKYKPGITFQFIPRWCEITRKEFRYFKNKFDAKCWGVKPLIAIKLSKIRSILKVKLEMDVKTREISNYFCSNETKKNTDLPYYYFEIFPNNLSYFQADEELIPVGNRTTKEMTEINCLDLSKENRTEGFLNWTMKISTENIGFVNEILKIDEPTQARSKSVDRTLNELESSKLNLMRLSNKLILRNTRKLLDLTLEKGREDIKAKKSISAKKSDYIKILDDSSLTWRKPGFVFRTWSGRQAEWASPKGANLIFAFKDKIQRDDWFDVLKWAIDMKRSS